MQLAAMHSTADEIQHAAECLLARAAGKRHVAAPQARLEEAAQPEVHNALQVLALAANASRLLISDKLDPERLDNDGWQIFEPAGGQWQTYELHL